MFSERRKCGKTIVSERKGDGPWCRIDDSTGRTVFRGTYGQCVTWLKARNAY